MTVSVEKSTRCVDFRISRTRWRVRSCTTIFVLALIACSPSSDTLINATNIQGDALPIPLTITPGDPVHGMDVFTHRDKGHCILCHQVNGLPAEFQGNIGPALTGLAQRLTPAQIRLRIVDYEQVAPGTLMPSYYRTHNLGQVQSAYKGQTILTAQEIEDIVAYLGTLK